MSDDGRATSRPAGLQRLIDRQLFPDVPVSFSDTFLAERLAAKNSGRNLLTPKDPPSLSTWVSKSCWLVAESAASGLAPAIVGREN